MRAWILVSTLLAASAAGCKDKGAELPEGSCVNTTDCDDGAICLQEQCRPVECTESAECAIEEYCDVGGGTYTCTAGCATDDDCIAGEECNKQAHTCEPYGCRSTELDCTYGEFCDTTTGECVADDRAHCESCDATNPNSCGGGNTQCVAFTGDSCQTQADCDAGYRCDNFVSGKFCHIDFCMVGCQPADEESCPRGFECLDIFGDNSFNACYADCEWLTDEGYL